jgi:hypothetical protein
MNNLLSAKSVLILESNGKEITRVSNKVSAENHALLTAELTLCVSQFLSGLSHRNFAVTGKQLIVNNAIQGAKEVSERTYNVFEKEEHFLIGEEGSVFFKVPKQKKEVKQMKQEQVEFDLSIGQEVAATEEQVKEWPHKCLVCGVNIGETVQYCGKHSKLKEEKSVNNPADVIRATLFGSNKAMKEVLLKDAGVADEVVGKVVASLTLKMRDKGLDITDKNTIAAYVLANKEEVSNIVKSIVGEEKKESHPELIGPMQNGFLDLLKKLDMYANPHIRAALTTFMRKGDEQRKFVNDVQEIFENDDKKIGQYFRDLLGIKAPNADLLKTSAYVTADSFRSTGNLIEAGVTKTVQALNKYVFQMAATIIEKPVGGRPEEIKDYNYVNDVAGRVWDKVKPEKKDKADNSSVANNL